MLAAKLPSKTQSIKTNDCEPFKNLNNHLVKVTNKKSIIIPSNNAAARPNVYTRLLSIERAKATNITMKNGRSKKLFV